MEVYHFYFSHETEMGGVREERFVGSGGSGECGRGIEGSGDVYWRRGSETGLVM